MRARHLVWIGLVLAVACGDDDRPEMDAGLDGPNFPDAPGIDAPGFDADPAGDAGMDDADTPDAVMADVGPSHCSDGVVSGDETDVDCGGPTCAARCEDMGECVVSPDCMSGVCIGFICQPPRCSDGVQNGMETGRDCGGPCPTACPLGSGCVMMSDCAEGVCDEGFCQAEHCFDDVRSGDESDVDCGGADCMPCPAGDMCVAPTDCASGSCEGGFCLTPECRNGSMDPMEAGIDCGGPDCPGCDDGESCSMPRDCASDRCEDGTCTSCNDDVLNGDETDVDCGGSCGGCPGDSMCTTGTDCASGECLPAGTCTGPSVYYQEDFEATNGGWTTGGTASSWEWGRPSDSIISSAATGINAWVTNLTGPYNSSEDSYIESPPIDLRGSTSDPILAFALIHRTELCCDEGWVEVSIDGGAYTKVGSAGTGTNWYNDSTNQWWDGDIDAWQLSTTTLTGTAGMRNVRIRVHFSSDGSVTDEGFGIDDVVIREPSPADLQVSLRALPDTCGILEATISNVGDMDSGSFRLETDLDGSVAMENVAGGLASGASITRMIDATGASLVTVTAVLMDDPDISNNSDSFTASMIFIPIDDLGYRQGFEASDGMWSGTGSWAHGVPAGTVIDSAAGGTQAWVTNLTGDYPSSESGTLSSPCFNASATTGDLLLSFMHNFETESCCDEGWIEYTLDGGDTWVRLLGGVSGMNWYNDTTNNWWDGNSSGWRLASAVIPGSAGASTLRIRHRVSADGSIQAEGFAIDDVQLMPLMTDLEVTLGPGLACGEAIATITNVGGNLVTRTRLSTRIDGGAPTTEVINEDIGFGESITRVVGTGGASMIQVSLTTAGDTNGVNDSAGIDVSPIAFAGSFSNDFETDGGGFVTAGMNSSWSRGTPSDAFITAAASGTNAWVTNPTGDYNNDELSYLLTPCFDFSGVGSDPTLSFSHIFRTQASGDEGWVEVSIDGGAWTKLGTDATGTNWYNDAANDWWDGSSGVAGGWVVASHPLTGTAGAGSVRVRWVMSSDASTANDGFGVDDVSIAP